MYTYLNEEISLAHKQPIETVRGEFFFLFCCLLVSLVPGLEKEIRRKTTTNERNNETKKAKKRDFTLYE